jgi:hypothetical protein
MACNTIKSFTYDSCVSNLGGIKKVWLSNYVENAATIAESGDTESVITGFSAGAKWIEYPFRKNTASLTSTLNVGDEGSSYVSSELSLVFSRMDTPKRLAVVALALGECMAVVEDSNGIRWFLGKDNPITCTAGTGETGTAKGDANHYTVTLTDESLEYPHQVADDVKLVTE